MQISNQEDKFFMGLYSLVILAAGLIITFTFKQLVFIVLLIVIEFIYLVNASRQIRKRRRAVKIEFPPEWQQFLQTHSFFYRNLDTNGQRHFERDIKIFLAAYSIKGIRQKSLDNKIKLLVASGVATMLHGRPEWEPPIPDGILVYPGVRFNQNYQLGKGNYAGMAAANQPLILTEGSLQHSLLHPNDGYNVVIHELAHYFDLEDGRAEGLPGSRLSFLKQKQWRTLMQKEWEKVLQGKSFLREYAGVNEAELFAVACESFFEKPWEVQANNPKLYQALQEFFNLDTNTILTSHPKK